jgi:hypothetical protein
MPFDYVAGLQVNLFIPSFDAIDDPAQPVNLGGRSEKKHLCLFQLDSRMTL